MGALDDLNILRVELEALDRRRAELAAFRNELIARARDEGASWQQLMDASGVTNGVVQRVLKEARG